MGKTIQHQPGRYAIYVQVTEWRDGRPYRREEIPFTASGRDLSGSKYLDKVNVRKAVNNAFIHARYVYTRRHGLPSGADLSFKVVDTEIEYLGITDRQGKVISTHRVENHKGRRKNVLRYKKGTIKNGKNVGGRIISWSYYSPKTTEEEYDKALAEAYEQNPDIDF